MLYNRSAHARGGNRNFSDERLRKIRRFMKNRMRNLSNAEKKRHRETRRKISKARWERAQKDPRIMKKYTNSFERMKRGKAKKAQLGELSSPRWKRCKVHNMLTGEVLEFDTLKAAGAAFGLSGNFMNVVKKSESKTFAPLGHFKKVVPVGLTLKERQEKMRARRYLKLELLSKN